MSPMTVFVRVLLKSSAICLGVALAIVQPSFDGGRSRRAVAQQSPVQAAIEGLVHALTDPDPGVRRNAAIALGDLRARISRQSSVASRQSQSAVPVVSLESSVDWRPQTGDSDSHCRPAALPGDPSLATSDCRPLTGDDDRRLPTADWRLGLPTEPDD